MLKLRLINKLHTPIFSGIVFFLQKTIKQNILIHRLIIKNILHLRPKNPQVW